MPEEPSQYGAIGTGTQPMRQSALGDGLQPSATARLPIRTMPARGISLHVAAPILGHGLTVGPAPWFRVERTALVMGPAAAVVGRFVNHQWQISGQFYTSFDLNRNAQICFQGEAEQPLRECGRFSDVRFNDGAIYGDDSVIATFNDEAQLWKCTLDGKDWPVILISSTEAQ